MNIDEFQRQEPPAGKRSSLEPHRAEIVLLSGKGYSHDQIQRWLASNGVTITRSAVQRFVQKHALVGSSVPKSNDRPPIPTTVSDQKVGHPLKAKVPAVTPRFEWNPTPDMAKLVGNKK